MNAPKSSVIYPVLRSALAINKVAVNLVDILSGWVAYFEMLGLWVMSDLLPAFYIAP